MGVLAQENKHRYLTTLATITLFSKNLRTSENSRVRTHLGFVMAIRVASRI